MATTYLTRTSGSPTLNTKYTLSFWVKRSKITYSECFMFDGRVDASNRFKLAFDANDKLGCFNSHSGSDTISFGTNRVFRDTSAWYNIILAVDTTQGTEADRVKLYVNGVQETSFSSTTYPSQNDANNVFNENSSALIIGAYYNATNVFDGLMSYVAFVDGTAELPGIFGETDSTTGEWKIKTTITPSVAWGNNGFLILKNGNSLTDESSNSNNWTLGAGTLTKTEDCPSNVFATMNVLGFTSAGLDIRNGNTYIFNDDNNNAFNTVYSTLGMTTGKYYWEIKCVGVWGSGSQMHGIGDLGSNAIQTATGQATDTNQAYGWRNNGSIQRGATTVAGTSWASSFTTGDILAFAFDSTNKKLYLKKNDVWLNSGDPTSGATGTGALSIVGDFDWGAISETKYGSDKPAYNYGNGYFVTTAVSSAGTNASGIGIFEYDVPNGYTALSTKGLNL